MGPHLYPRLSRVSSALLSLGACLVGAAGCNNTCVSGTLNSPGGGTVNVKAGSPPPSCPLSAANAIVHFEIGATPEAALAHGIVAPPTGPHMIHLYVTVAAVDAHSSPLAVDDTPGWQPLTAPLQQHPVQLDLLAEPGGDASSAPLPDTVVPAGVYRQIRLQLAGPHAIESVLEANHCGAGVPHCAVMSDGRVWPLAFPSSRPDLRIVLDGTPGHELYVPPDGAVTLVIELDQDRSFLWPSGDSFLLNPVLHLRVLQPFNVSEN